MNRTIAGFLLLVACVLSQAADPRAQQASQLRVKVVDQGGGSLPNATLAVVHPDGVAASLAATETIGIYTVSGLMPGRYILTVEAEGFAPSKRPIEIRANRLTDLTVVLTLHTTESVRVAGLTSGIPSNLTSMTLSGLDLALLPNNDLDLLRRLQEMAGSRGQPGDVAIYVDGFREFRRLPPRSAIELIQINAEPYSAQFPEPGSRRVEIVTKPGSEGRFGELKSDFNDEALNAREPLATRKPALQRRTLSGYYSAAIIPQRWGFYVYAGRWEQDENAVIRATTLDETLEPAPFHQTLASPARLNHFTGNTGFGIGNMRLKAEYSREQMSASNQGLKSGLDLPERGITSTTTTDVGRFSLLSILTQTAVYEMRVEARRDASRLRAASGRTAILVLDAFNSGANQDALYNDTTTDSAQLDAKLTKVVGSHTLKLGGQADYLDLSQVNFANFGGTFVFGADVERDERGRPVLSDSGATVPVSPLESYRRTRLGLAGYQPTLFTLTTGDPSASARQWRLAGYLQDDWVRSKEFTLSAGIRYETQTDLDERLFLAPRVGMAWSLRGPGGVIRAGAGVFSRRVEPALTLNTIRFDGQRQKEYVVQNPTFRPPPAIDQTSEQQTIITFADGMDAGRLVTTNASYERAIAGPLFGSVTYTYEQGDRLTRSTDINVPLTPGGARPVLTAGRVLEYRSVGRSERHEMQVGLRASLGTAIALTANYTLASANADGDNAQTIPADSRHIANEWGRVAIDERHRVYFNGTLMLPRSFLVIPSFTYATPRPFNITTGFDNNQDGHVTDRPSFAAAGDLNAIATPYGWLNPFPGPGDTIIPRNFGRGGRLLKFDLSFAKVFVLDNPAEARRVLGVTATFENLLNLTNLRDYNGVLTSPRFGAANTSEPGRRASLGLSFNF
jgi:hypothetical protein